MIEQGNGDRAEKSLVALWHGRAPLGHDTFGAVHSCYPFLHHAGSFPPHPAIVMQSKRFKIILCLLSAMLRNNRMEIILTQSLTLSI